MDVFFEKVHLVEQVFPHETYIGLQLAGRHGVIFIHVEGDDVAEAELLLLVHAYQFVINLHRCGACGQAQHEMLSLRSFVADGPGDAGSHHP